MSRIANYCSTCGSALSSGFYSGRERPYCKRCETPIYFGTKVAVVVFIEYEGKVLLTQRSMNPGLGKWSLPGGFADYDEAPEEAARREILEETALEVEIDTLLAVFPKRDQGMADLVIAYGATVVSGEAQAGDDAAAIGWFSPDTIPPLVFYPCISLTGIWHRGELKC